MLTLASLCASCASLHPTDSAKPSGAASAPAQDADAIHYRVVIDAPKEVVELLRQSVGLVRWQSYADMTDDLLGLLSRGAVDESRDAV